MINLFANAEPGPRQSSWSDPLTLRTTITQIAVRGLLLATIVAPGLALADDAHFESRETALSSEALTEGDTPADALWKVDGQFTNVTQGHPQFRSPYSGANSLQSNGRTEETSDLTIYVGRRLWHGAELWVNPEIDQGFGLDNTLGMAGFPSGEAYKIGANAPYWRLPRIFVRQVIPLGGAKQAIDPEANQLGGSTTADNLVVTVGKFSVVDIFDTNHYAHDPRADFMNWSAIDAGAFDYAADPWGYTYGAAVEWTHGWWTLRSGLFQISSIPNGKITAVDFSQYSLIAELETRHEWGGHPGKIKILGFVNRARMAKYQDALDLARQTGGTPDVALVRRAGSRPGISINLEQELSPVLGAFARVSVNDGSKEAYEFTEINRSLSAGLSLKGDHWGRGNDTLGAAAVVNALSGSAREYFAAGGLGILIGDGRLHYGPEKILEVYYSLGLGAHLALALDYQYVSHPAYNQDRGPVSFYGVRLHSEF